jgi:hypothetical protein
MHIRLKRSVHGIAAACLLAGPAVATSISPGIQDGNRGRAGEPSAQDAGSSFIDCTEASLIAAVAKANDSKGGLITFDCHNATIPIRSWMGRLQNRVVIDGQNKNLTLEFRADFSNCLPGDNGIKGRPIAILDGQFNAIRNLTFRNFLESLQISGPDNLVEHNRFYGHPCSDDGLSMVRPSALNTVVRGNHFENYTDKAFQLSYGGARIEGNTFTNTAQPIRSAYDNSAGEPIYVTGNGLSPGSTPAGGVVILESAHVDLGGGSVSINGKRLVSPGKNRIQGNGPRDVRNLASRSVSARHNCWDHSTPGDVKISDTEGSVEVDPVESCPK